MSTSYMRMLLEGAAPSVDDWNEHLIAFHTRYQSATSQLSSMLTPTGESSYRVLARRAQELVPMADAILDIGCGGGLLVRELRDTYDRRLELVGIDLCAAEIARARALVDDAVFVCGDARTANFGAPRFDAIVMHLAIMIASQPQVILARARAAMREGGVLLMLMEAFPLHPVIADVVGAGLAEVRAAHAGFTMIVPEGKNLADDAELRQILAEAGFGRVDVEEHVVGRLFTASELWAYVQRFYPFGLLDASIQERMRGAIEAAVSRRLNEDGCVEITFPLRLAIARA